MKKVLIDTNIYSFALKGNVEVVNALRRIEVIGFSAISIGELFSGFKGGSRETKNREALNLFLDSPRVVVHPIDAGTTDFYASILNNLKMAGTNQMLASMRKYQNNKKFDLILSVDVLEHIEDDRTLIHGFSGLLKPGGFLIISTPSLLRTHEHDGSFVGEHFREGYSKEDIEEKLKDAGLAVKKFEYSYGFFGDLSWRLGIKNTMQLASKGRAGMIAGMFYFTLVLIPVLFLMILDFLWPNKQGTGIVVTAEKK